MNEAIKQTVQLQCRSLIPLNERQCKQMLDVGILHNHAKDKKTVHDIAIVSSRLVSIVTSNRCQTAYNKDYVFLTVRKSILNFFLP